MQTMVTRRYPTTVVALSTALCLLSMLAGYAFKVRCFGPSFDANGVSQPDLFFRWTSGGCYTDIQTLWGGRQLFEHRAPYTGGFSEAGGLVGGTLEYPVLSGVLIWLVALPSSTDLEFFRLSAVTLAICGIGVAAMLARLTGWRSLWWSLAPGLVLYSVLNWDLYAVAATTGALALVLSHQRGHRTGRLMLAAVLFAVGGALKLYPLMFVAPVALWIGLDQRTPSTGTAAVANTAGARWRVAAAFVAVAAGVFIVVNLPFAIAHFEGWWAAFEFQWHRPIDNATNSIWYWGLRPYSDSGNVRAQQLMALASTIATAASLVIVCLWGWQRGRRAGEYPWLQVSAAMLCGYLLFNKVHSPQYMLWLLPFLVLVRIPAPWILGYFLADVFVGVGFLQRIAAGTASIEDSVWPQIYLLGVWGRAVLLALLAVVFLRSDTALGRRTKEARPASFGQPAVAATGPVRRDDPAGSEFPPAGSIPADHWSTPVALTITAKNPPEPGGTPGRL